MLHFSSFSHSEYIPLMSSTPLYEVYIGISHLLYVCMCVCRDDHFGLPPPLVPGLASLPPPVLPVAINILEFLAISDVLEQRYLRRCTSYVYVYVCICINIHTNTYTVIQCVCMSSIYTYIPTLHTYICIGLPVDLHHEIAFTSTFILSGPWVLSVTLHSFFISLSLSLFLTNLPVVSSSSYSSVLSAMRAVYRLCLSAVLLAYHPAPNALDNSRPLVKLLMSTFLFSPVSVFCSARNGLAFYSSVNSLARASLCFSGGARGCLVTAAVKRVPGILVFVTRFIGV